MSESISRFLDYVPVDGRILDFGCGSGRNTKFFLEHGYEAGAIDGSQALCESASQLIGKSVTCMRFQDFTSDPIYDGI